MTESIRLYCGLEVSVSAEDASRLRAHKWHALRGGNTVYARSSVKFGDAFRSVLMHRMILGAEAGNLVDHIDGNGLNNQRSNLRLATPQQNAWNRRGRGESKYQGVRRINGKWAAFVSPSGLDIYLGTYATERQAASVAAAAAQRVYGEFAQKHEIAADHAEILRVIAVKRASIARVQREIDFLEVAE